MAQPVSDALGIGLGEERAAAQPEASVRDYIALLKPGVLLLVVFSAMTGMLLAPTAIHPFVAIISLLAIAGGSGASAMFNMWYDRDIDQHMSRTQNRPIPAGRIAADDALVLCAMIGIASIGLLGLATNWLAASILAFAMFFYSIIYTHSLKRHTPQNIVIGGAAGAFPPVIGWLATMEPSALTVSELLAPMPWALFLIIFLWTPPHFWALSLYRHEDYKRVGVPMYPVVKGEAATKRAILCYSIALVISTFIPSFLIESHWLYSSVAALLGGNFLRHAMKVLKSENPKDAIRMFLFSISYLFILFFALLCQSYI